MTTRTQYAEIAKEYAESQDNRKLRWGITDPSLYKQIGDLSGLDVLDLACGDGRLSREIKKRGAKSVVGVDAEQKMVEMARAREDEEKLGIEYQQGKVGELEKIGKFDIVVGGFLFHYAKTKDELYKMFEDAYKNLKDGGRVVAINMNPNCPRNLFPKYGSTVVPIKDPLKEGDLVKITICTPEEKPTISFTSTHWEQQTYEKIMRDVGFKDIQWIPMSVSERGIKELGKEFWQDWLDSPSLTILEARKY